MFFVVSLGFVSLALLLLLIITTVRTKKKKKKKKKKKMGDEKSKKFENGYELFTKNLYKKENKPCRKYSTARNTTTMSTNTGTSVSSSR